MNPAELQKHRPGAANADDNALFSKLDWHILPPLIICYVVAAIDRINIGYAKLQMQETLAFSDEAYAFGAGVFLIGYFLFAVPSNLLLDKIGARKTLLRIMFCWGLCAAAMVFVQSTTMFYLLRFLLGALEAGFFPGVILYLTYWYPAARRGKAIAIFMTGVALAYLLVGPTSGAIIKYAEGWLGYHGWQWLFVVQGLPASALGIVAFFVLKDKPEQASWLTDAEKAALRKHLDTDAQAVETASHASLGDLLRDPRIYMLSLIWILLHGAHVGMVFWLPTLIKSWRVADPLVVGLLVAFPALLGIVAMVGFGRSSDRNLERRWHFFLSCALASAGILVAIIAQGNLVVSVAGLCLLGVGQAASGPMLFTAFSEYIPKKTAAAGIALISSLGNLGPALMPSVSIWINTTTGTPANSMYLAITLYLTAGAILIVVLRPSASRRERRVDENHSVGGFPARGSER